MFSVEFFSFIRKIVNCTAPPPRSDKLVSVYDRALPFTTWNLKNPHILTRKKLTFQPTPVEELSLLGIQLASQFLFHSGLRTKKTLRGPAIDWYEDFQMNSNSWCAFIILFSFLFCVRQLNFRHLRIHFNQNSMEFLFNFPGMTFFVNIFECHRMSAAGLPQMSYSIRHVV